jgi:hypothetical protein
MSIKKNSSHVTKTSDLAKLGSDAVATLKQLTSELPIDDALTPKELAAAKVSNRVPLEAIAVASSVLNEAPEQFPQFDAVGTQTAVEYETTMAPVAQAARVLAERIEKSILKSRSGVANQTLALYAVMKGTARLPASEVTRTQVKQLAALLTTRHKSRNVEVTQDEALKLTRVLKSQKKVALAQAKVASAAKDAAFAQADAAMQAAVNADVLLQTPAQAAASVSAAPVATSTPATPAGPTTGASST